MKSSSKKNSELSDGKQESILIDFCTLIYEFKEKDNMHQVEELARILTSMKQMNNPDTEPSREDFMRVLKFLLESLSKYDDEIPEHEQFHTEIVSQCSRLLSTDITWQNLIGKDLEQCKTF